MLGQKEGSQEVESRVRLHSLSFNPIKPFIGLPNFQYEFQVRHKWSIALFSEYLAYNVISDFEHPDMVSKLGLAYYPFTAKDEINEGLYAAVTVGWVLYRKPRDHQHFLSNGLEVGYKWLWKKHAFLQPRAMLNYLPANGELLPGFELLLGYTF